MLTIALPKGRISEEVFPIFENIIKEKLNFKDRELIFEANNFKFLYVRNKDIPLYVYYGVADLGVVGLDVLEENDVDLIRLLDLKIAKCRVCIGLKKAKTLCFNKPEIRVATTNVNISKKYFLTKSVNAHIIKLSGSVEIAAILDLADCIVDIVQTGKTMEQNGLYIAKTIMESSACLVANKYSYLQRKKEILALYEDIKELI